MKKWLFLLLLAGCGSDLDERVCRRAFECQILDVGQSVDECQVELEEYEADLSEVEVMLVEGAIERCMRRPTCADLAYCLAHSY